MTYKNKFICLISIISVLSLLYIGSFIFNAGFIRAGSSLYVWLDSRNAERITRITVSTVVGDFELNKINNLWYVLQDGQVFPARQLRVDDFLRIFTTRASWPVRSSNVTSHERYGLDEFASRITMYENNIIHLDLLAGYDDFTGLESFFRRAGQNEVRSGDNNINSYIYGQITNWFNLRLISENEGSVINSSDVQRLSVFTPEGQQVFTRRNRTWGISGIDIVNPDVTAIENYIRTIINTEGDYFEEIDIYEDDLFDHSSIVIEFGNGKITTIQFSQPDEQERRLARVVGSEYIYSIPMWAAFRLFPEPSTFELY